MAYSQETRALPPAIATSLEHLAHRPGVVATLILSRKDGSIIRATGILAESRGGSTGEEQAIQGETSQEDDETISASATDESKRDTAAEPTAAESFAASVAAFVMASASMNDALKPSIIGKAASVEPYGLLNGNASDQRSSLGDKEGLMGSTRDLADVQLLRMRTKSHEVVIFPDSKFLSCVVQEVGKHAPQAGPGPKS